MIFCFFNSSAAREINDCGFTDKICVMGLLVRRLFINVSAGFNRKYRSIPNPKKENIINKIIILIHYGSKKSDQVFGVNAIIISYCLSKQFHELPVVY